MVRKLSSLLSTVKNLPLHDRQTKLDNLSSWEIGTSSSLVILEARLHFTLSALYKAMQWERSTTEEQSRHFAIASSVEKNYRILARISRAFTDSTCTPCTPTWHIAQDSSSVSRFRWLWALPKRDTKSFTVKYTEGLAHAHAVVTRLSFPLPQESLGTRLSHALLDFGRGPPIDC